MTTYKKGINLGGWLAQYDRFLDVKAHYATFITPKDLDQIASWGADHVRVPFEFGILTDATFEYLDRCVEWCKSRGLGVILDLHYVQGQSYDTLLAVNPMFLPQGRDIFVKVWDKVAKHFAAAGDEVAFELFNEAQDNTGYLWNAMIPLGIAAIRKHNQKSAIYVGSNHMNSVFTLDALPLQEDGNIVYNFHFYEPHPFTHQRAHFDRDMVEYDTAISFPGGFPHFKAFLDGHPVSRAKSAYLLWHDCDETVVQRGMEHAKRFRDYTGKPLYCGEFGVIECAPEEDAARWVRACVARMREMDVGYAYWTYKLMDFGLVDENSRLRFPKLVEAVFQE